MYANGQHAQFGSKLTTCVYVYIGSYLVADMRLLRYKSLSRVGSTKAAVFPEQVRTMSIVKETQTRGVDRKKKKKRLPEETRRPDPVTALPHTSKPERILGMVAACETGEGGVVAKG